MKQLALFSTFILLFLTACETKTEKSEVSPLTIDGFVSNESEGNVPQFDLIAKHARMGRSDSEIIMEEISLTLYNKGKKESLLSASHGTYFIKNKRVELSDGVTYHHLKEQIEFQSPRMTWDTVALRSFPVVTGLYQGIKFKGTYLKIRHDGADGFELRGAEVESADQKG